MIEEEAKPIDCLNECTKYDKCYPFVNPLICTQKEVKVDESKLLTEEEIQRINVEAIQKSCKGNIANITRMYLEAQLAKDEARKDEEIREILHKMNKRDVGGVNPEWALSNKDYQALKEKGKSSPTKEGG